jgi:Laminin G domain.
MVIVHYGQVWGDLLNGKTGKDFHTLTLDNGNPTLYISPDSRLIPVNSLQLNDDKWHHISVSMSEKSCLLSEVLMYIDGNKVDAFVPNLDKHIFHVTSGSMSIAGFGYTSNFDELFPHMKPFVGALDEFILFGKPAVNHLGWMTAPSYVVRYATNCVAKSGLSTTTVITSHKKCRKLCDRTSWCKGYQLSKQTGQNQCTLFEMPEYGTHISKVRCAILP